jgi:hypothetical protein
MTNQKIEPEVHVHDPSKLKGTLKAIGGSMSDDWNNTIANQTANAVFRYKNDDPETAKRGRFAAVAAVIGLKPTDEIEGMIAAQLIACHNAAMECYRRAMLPDISFDMRHGNLNSANKLSRTYSTLLESLNRHRGKGQQKVTVEHVHVHEGGQAIVGNVEGGGVAAKSKDQPHALTHAPGQTLPSENTARDRVPITRDEERAMPDARRGFDGRTEGEP